MLDVAVTGAAATGAGAAQAGAGAAAGAAAPPPPPKTGVGAITQVATLGTAAITVAAEDDAEGVVAGEVTGIPVAGDGDGEGVVAVERAPNGNARGGAGAGAGAPLAVETTPLPTEGDIDDAAPVVEPTVPRVGNPLDGAGAGVLGPTGTGGGTAPMGTEGCAGAGAGGGVAVAAPTGTCVRLA